MVLAIWEKTFVSMAMWDTCLILIFTMKQLKLFTKDFLPSSDFGLISETIQRPPMPQIEFEPQCSVPLQRGAALASFISSIGKFSFYLSGYSFSGSWSSVPLNASLQWSPNLVLFSSHNVLSLDDLICSINHHLYTGASKIHMSKPTLSPELPLLPKLASVCTSPLRTFI
jgi:hypothetical protein